MGEDLSKARVKVEVIYDDDDTEKNWIGLERSFGDGKTENSTTYLVTSELENGRKNAAGKRKYFTTNLTTETLAGAGEFNNQDGTSSKGGQKIIVPVADECIWIYVDECTQTGDDVRSATVRVSFSLDGVNFSADQSMDYVINQRMLFPVTYNGRNYHIEYHEEYLHNYDAEDSYGQTEYEGMQWGAENVQFSSKYPAVYVDLTGGLMSWLDRIGIELSGVTNNIIAGVKPYYDFYLRRDKESLGLTEDSNISDDEWDGVVIRDYSGYNFSQEIISKLTAKGKISNGTLSATPLSAAEYCYNKNKRNEKGEVTNVVWYLPAIDEIEEIVTSKYTSKDREYNTYARFEEFQEKFYWSSQPAYIYDNLKLTIKYYITLGTAAGKLFVDNIGDSQQNDPGSARATRVSYDNNQYKAIPSGISGATDEIAYTQDRGILSDPTYTPISPAPTPDIGYLLRNSVARVRCVRKQ